MSWPVGEQLRAYKQRTEAGPGATAAPSGGPTAIKNKAIPNVDDDRLTRALDDIHGRYHTQAGLGQHDGPRRDLLDNGAKGRMISHELLLRGHDKGDCRYCWGD